MIELLDMKKAKLTKGFYDRYPYSDYWEHEDGFGSNTIFCGVPWVKLVKGGWVPHPNCKLSDYRGMGISDKHLQMFFNNISKEKV